MQITEEILRQQGIVENNITSEELEFYQEAYTLAVKLYPHTPIGDFKAAGKAVGIATEILKNLPKGA